MSSQAAPPASSTAERRPPSQLRGLLRASHPVTALALAVVVGALVALMGRPPREVAVSAVAVLLAQLAAGLLNDYLGADDDLRAGRTRKPVAEGHLAPGNVTFAVAALLLVLIPLALQNGIVAGLYLLATLPVAYVHDRWLRRTPLSFVGWALTYALLAGFVTWGGWGNQTEGTAPLPSFTAYAALLGVCVHVLTALPDLPGDHQSGTRHLPLRIALRTGAPVLLGIGVVATLVVVGLLVQSALTVGIAS